MDEERLRQFADQLDADSDDIIDRWQGRPDRIIDDLFRVRDQDTGQLRDLELFDVQRDLVHAYFYGDVGTLVAYKGRRIGYSFAVIACFLVESLFYPDSFYPLVSRSLSQSKDRIDDIQDLIDHAKITIPTVKENTDYIELWNGSAFMAYSADSDTSRGADSARAVLMDEMAFMEDQESAHRAFGGFLALGKNRKMVEVSTPNTKNDLFMQDYRRGEDSEHAISIKQPTFANAESIDVHTPLHDQELEPVRPEINISQLESERLRDPEGFGQEYLCRPVANEYNFFDEDRVDDAIRRSSEEGYAAGLGTQKPYGSRRIIGVDLGINRDDTAIAVTDHDGEERNQRAVAVADDDLFMRYGIPNGDRSDPEHVSKLVSGIFGEMNADLAVIDRGGVGQPILTSIQNRLGKNAVGFDFSDKEAVTEMMGDMNAALHRGHVTLIDDDRMRDELLSIVKEKRDDYQKPKFSGKDNSESGKDDVAIATILSCYPPTESTSPIASPASKERAQRAEEQGLAASAQTSSGSKPDGERRPSYGATSVSRGTRSRKNRYTSKRRRR